MLIYLERHATAAEARAREKQFKFWGKPGLAPAQPRVKG